MIRCACPHCHGQFTAAQEQAGCVVLCPSCHKNMRVPGPPKQQMTAPQPLMSEQGSNFQFDTRPREQPGSALDEVIGFAGEERDPIPERLRAEVATLGNKERVYGMNFFNFSGMIGVTLLSVGGLSLFIPLAVPKMLPVIGMSVVALGIGFLCMIPHLLRWGETVVLYEKGFVYLCWNRAEVHRFDRILRITGTVTIVVTQNREDEIRRSYHCTIVPYSGPKLVLRDTLEQVQLLGTRLLIGVEASPLHGLIEQFHETAVQFGPLMLDQVGVSKGDEVVSWREIEGAALHNGNIGLRRRGGQFHQWQSGPVRSGPGMEQCLPMLEYCIAAYRRFGFT